MLIQNLLKLNHKLKKSQLLLIGSFLIFFGFLILFSNYFGRMREEVFSDMKISMMGFTSNTRESLNYNPLKKFEKSEEKEFTEEIAIDYSVYFGIIEIPRIGLKRGFYSFDDPLNSIDKNVTLVKGSDLPDVSNGNMILMAHSGDSYISYFAYLYLLEIGDDCFITYNNQNYHYQIKNIYTVYKNGMVSIDRNYDKTTLTMITCTKNDDTLQTVYIAELIE